MIQQGESLCAPLTCILFEDGSRVVGCGLILGFRLSLWEIAN